VTFANNASLAGHVVVDDWAILGGFTGVHQFCRIGAHVMTAVSSVILQDVPPYRWRPAIPRSLRHQRRGPEAPRLLADALLALKRAYRTLYKSGLLLEEAKAKLAEAAKTQPEVQRFVDFLEVSKRGIIR
jgi:UDP-N-acetylglucosamine acyltransferase